MTACPGCWRAARSFRRLALFLAGCVPVISGAEVEITSFGANGTLSYRAVGDVTNLALAWAASPTGAWHRAGALARDTALPASASAGVEVPAFYKLVGELTATAPLSGEEMVVAPAGTNAGFDPAEDPYVESANGPPYHYCITLSEPVWVDRYEASNDDMVRVLNWAYGQGLLVVTPTAVSNRQGVARLLVNLGANSCRILWDSGSSTFGMKAMRGSGYPCVQVSWYGAVAYCNWRSLMNGLVPCYDLDDIFGDVLSTNCNYAASGYRLPRGHEWEYLARGGFPGRRFPWGDYLTPADANYSVCWGVLKLPVHPPSIMPYYDYDLAHVGGRAPDIVIPELTVWYDPAYSAPNMAYTAPVHSYKPNGYGLYNIVGNVTEACIETTDKPLRRQQRGGSWQCEARYLRNRHFGNLLDQGAPDDDNGFRTLRRAGPHGAAVTYTMYQ